LQRYTAGEKRLYGEYLLNSQGEDVVVGLKTTDARQAPPKPQTLNNKP
jgi:hypothetical protein